MPVTYPMSTYKEQPKYAEVIFEICDMFAYTDPPASPQEVSTWVDWNFHGGTLGSYPMRKPTATSETTFPHGPLACNLVPEISRPLMQILVNRRNDYRKSARRRKESLAIAWMAMTSIAGLSESRPARSGLCAVYAAARMLLAEIPQVETKDAWVGARAFVLESMQMSAEASRLPADVVFERSNQCILALEAVGIRALDKAREVALRLLIETSSGHAHSMARRVGAAIFTAGSVAAADVPPSRGCYYMPFGSGAFRLTANCVTFRSYGQAYIMGRSDITRLHQMLRGLVSGIVAAAAQAAFSPGANRLRVRELARAHYRLAMSMMVSTADYKPQNEVLLAKAYKRLLAAYLGEVAGPLCADETRELWAELQGTPEVPMGTMHAHVAEMRKWDLSTALNIGKIYKILPPPDISPGAILLDRHKTVTNANVMQAHAVEPFRRAHRDQMLRAYIRAPGVRLELRNELIIPEWWAAYKSRRFDEVPSSEISEFLEWEGTAAMPLRSPINPACWKDSGLGWDTWEVAIDPDRNRKHGNMLLRMLYDNECPMPGTRHVAPEHCHKVDGKPENYKGDAEVEEVTDGAARGIYSGNLCDRLNQSWMEVAVDAVTKFHPAFMIGASITTRDTRLSAVLSRNISLETVDVYYSFDIKGWSPLMPGTVQRISHGNWADLYDEQLFRDAHRINEGSRVYMNKAGYQGWYINPDANFEGYNGREMTFELITLMSMSIGEWRRAVVQEGVMTERDSESLSALLLGYIDDGLAKATIPRVGARQVFSIWKRTTERVFRECGFTLEISKCYPSDRFAIFLNEIYFMGRQIAHGARAAMTMCSENVQERVTFLEKTTSVATGARGAVVSGLDAPAAALLMYLHIWDHLSAYKVGSNTRAAAVWVHAPRAWGGLGLPSMLQLSTSGGGAATEEAAYIVQSWARHSQACMSFLRSIVAEGYEKRTARGILSSPLGGSVRRGVIPVDAVAHAVREAMAVQSSNDELSSLAREFLTLGNDEAFGEFARLILDDVKVIQEQVLRDAYAALPHQIFSAFCTRVEKSTTLRSIIGGNMLGKIRREDRMAVRDSYFIAVRRMM